MIHGAVVGEQTPHGRAVAEFIEEEHASGERVHVLDGEVKKIGFVVERAQDRRTRSTHLDFRDQQLLEPGRAFLRQPDCGLVGE